MVDGEGEEAVWIARLPEVVLVRNANDIVELPDNISIPCPDERKGRKSFWRFGRGNIEFASHNPKHLLM